MDPERRAARREQMRYERQMEVIKEAWMAERGLAETGGNICLHRLVGGRHRWPKCYGDRCRGCYDLGSGIFDHPYGLYRTGDGRRLECIVTHPYQYSDRDIQEIEKLCREFGLCYEIRPPSESWYRQGSTYMVVIKRADGADADSEHTAQQSLSS